MRALRRLSPAFFRRSPQALARALLGKVLVHGDRAGVIVETEAYLGPEDAASHARFGKTARNAVMFGPGGVSYVYLCYGMYDLFNVVAGRDGDAGAVLVRALEPWRGLGDDPALARGPGKLTRALALSRDHNGVDLAADERLYVAAATRRRSARIAVGPRVGVDYAGEWARAALRFWIDGHPAVSRPPRARSAALMPTVTFMPDQVRADCADGESVFDAGRRAGVAIETACVGRATCGLCRVKVVAGEEHLSAQNDAERAHLGNVYYLTKVRLSCQAVVRGGDVVVELSPKRKRKK